MLEGDVRLEIVLLAVSVCEFGEIGLGQLQSPDMRFVREAR